jgi:calcium-dependent protein kinase
MASKEELETLKRVFKALDTNNDGKLQLEEILEGCKKHAGEITEKKVRHTIDEMDAAGNGEIEYSEWVIATISKKDFLTDERFQVAFNMIDNDHSRSISAEEVKNVLGGGGKNIDEKVWDKILREVDTDEDGEVDFGEFKTMMQKIHI